MQKLKRKKNEIRASEKGTRRDTSPPPKKNKDKKEKKENRKYRGRRRVPISVWVG